MNEFFDKEEWASRKQQDRESAYAMVDDALKKVGTDGKAFQTFWMPKATGAGSGTMPGKGGAYGRSTASDSGQRL